MGFTSSIFLFCFIPLTVILYFGSVWLCKKNKSIKKIRLDDIVLIILSLFFYAWTLAEYFIWLPMYILLVYSAGWLIHYFSNFYLQLPFYRKEADSYQKVPMCRIVPAVFSFFIFIVLLILIRYKYADFLNSHLGPLGFHVSDGFLLSAPLGISFIVFSSVSYLADIMMKKAEPGNFLDCALYISFFPKIVSGPIILWRDFSSQIQCHVPSLETIVSGIDRICIGFAKKVLLADVFGAAIAQIENMGVQGIDTPTVWITVVLYMLQIYYDFAGYSDIAIGLTRSLGFACDENFNFPYCAPSITSFWRRWHISLGRWFREYVYIPLGGNRKGLPRTLLNLAVVFLLTGIWHGAGWNYILWGGINAFMVIVERLIKDKSFYIKTPYIIKWALTMFTVLIFWELFRYNDLEDFWACIASMFSPTGQAVSFSWKFFLDRKLIAHMTIGILGATVLGWNKINLWVKKYAQTKPVYVVEQIALLILMGLSIISVVSSSYSPFIYFQY